MTWFDLFSWVSESILTYEIRIWTSQMWNTFSNFSLGSCRSTSVDMNYESSFYLLWCWITLRFLKTFYFILGYSWLIMLWWFQVNSGETQPYLYMYLFSPKLLSHPGWHTTCVSPRKSSPVQAGTPRAVRQVLVGPSADKTFIRQSISLHSNVCAQYLQSSCSRLILNFHRASLVTQW